MSPDDAYAQYIADKHANESAADGWDADAGRPRETVAEKSARLSKWPAPKPPRRKNPENSCDIIDGLFNDSHPVLGWVFAGLTILGWVTIGLLGPWAWAFVAILFFFSYNDWVLTWVAPITGFVTLIGICIFAVVILSY